MPLILLCLNYSKIKGNERKSERHEGVEGEEVVVGGLFSIWFSRDAGGSRYRFFSFPRSPISQISLFDNSYVL